jgi:hypothetical protein
MTDKPITPEALADAILRASGSSLRDYPLFAVRQQIITAARDGIERARLEGIRALSPETIAEGGKDG